MGALTEQLGSGVLASSQLTARLAVSPQTLMRMVRAEEGRIVRIGRARATKYGLRRPLSALEASEVPLFRIDAEGKPSPIGHLAVLTASETAWLPAGHVFQGLPPEVADMRPSGFMGRAFPKRYPELPVPPRIQDWSDDHTLIALARRGDEFSGNLIVGDESMDRWFSNKPKPVARSGYPALADTASAGAPPGSSAGGEQPKFGAYVDGCHYLVKYANGGGHVAERWQDLLRLEAIALEVLDVTDGAGAAPATIFEFQGYVFLEVKRFDRIGERGRRAAISLAATGVDPSRSWASAANRLSEAKQLSNEDARRLRLYDAFARCIANPDRHHFNVVVFLEHSGVGEKMSVRPTRYRLAPAFDQLPMLYAPTRDGQVPSREFKRPSPTADIWEVWDEARALATAFWEKASKHDRVSTAMRETAARNARILVEA